LRKTNGKKYVSRRDEDMIDNNKLRSVIAKDISNLPINNASLICHTIDNVIKNIKDNYIIYERKNKI
jgi:hypothetical protein